MNVNITPQEVTEASDVEPEPLLQMHPQPLLPIITPSIPSYAHSNSRVYQYPKTRKTELMMKTMESENLLPSVMIQDPFIYMDLNKVASSYSKDTINEWVRTSQILLFDQFQECMRHWTDITKSMKEEIFKLKYQHKKKRYLKARKIIDINSTKIDAHRVQCLPDDVIQHIWKFADIETKNKYLIGKYFGPSKRFQSVIQRLNFKVLKTLYKKTIFCYHGLCMQKIIPSERYFNPPMSKKTKQDIIREITKIMEDYLDMYDDALVFTTYRKSGETVTHKEEYRFESEIHSLYSGFVYPLHHYETKMYQLWNHLTVAFHHFIPTDYFHQLCVKNSHSDLSIQIPHPHESITVKTPPLPETPEHITPQESPISFIIL
jgi:hypothetical protein